MAVDIDPERARLAETMGARGICEEGVSFLVNRLERENPDWIVPALPLHLVFNWLLAKLGDTAKRVELPSDLDQGLPHPLRGKEGDIYVTRATWRCPEDCPEPGDICTVTKEKRPVDMFKLLGDTRFQDFQPLVIRSHQLAPGVGGYRPQALLELLEAVRQAATPVMVCTACRCHGVVSGLEMDRD